MRQLSARPARALGIWLALAILLVEPAVSAEEPTYRLNMQNADIVEVVNLVARATGKTFIVGPGVRDQMTVVSDRVLSRDELYQVFLATLEVHGFSAVDIGSVTKIIGQADAASAGLPVLPAIPTQGEDLVTQVCVHQLKNYDRYLLSILGWPDLPIVIPDISVRKLTTQS